MCGICGQVGGKHHQATKGMTAMLNHRGPDATGYWTSQDVSLGHARLSIVDLSDSGNQPFIGYQEQIIVIVNGEIYNYQTLKNELETAGAIFTSQSDCEVVLHAYWLWGKDAFSKFNGMFAAAIYDKRDNSLILVRDKLGIKPLYFWQNGQNFCFASEIKAIVATAGKSHWEINHQSFLELMEYQNIFGSKTLFSDVKIIEPGTYLRFQQGNIKISRYWSLDIKPQEDAITSEYAKERFAQALRKSVSRHLNSDVPVASYLSAGFDSSIVTAIARKHYGAKLCAFTGAFGWPGWYDEDVVAKEISNHINCKHQVVQISADDFIDNIDDVVFSLDEPRMGIGSFSQYMVAKEAAKTHRVILTGHGGDELFSGYPIFKFVHGIQTLKMMNSNALKFLVSIKFTELIHFLYFGFRWLFQGGSLFVFPVLTTRARLKLLLQEKYSKMFFGKTTIDKRNIALKNTKNKPIDNVFLIYMKHYLHGLLLVEDKISMAHSLEARTPLLDDALLELSSKLSQDTKLYNSELKYLIKQAAKKDLPDILFKQPKKGFPTPAAKWFRGPLKSWVYQRLVSDDCSLNIIFKKEELKREVDRYMNSKTRYFRPLDEIPTHRIWQLIALENCFRQYKKRLGVQLCF